MFNLQGSEIIFILLIALVVLGPEKLPGAIRRATSLYAELRKMSSGFQNEFKAVLDEPLREFKSTADLVRNAADPKRLAQEAEREAELEAAGAKKAKQARDVTAAMEAAGAAHLAQTATVPTVEIESEAATELDIEQGIERDTDAFADPVDDGIEMLDNGDEVGSDVAAPNVEEIVLDDFSPDDVTDDITAGVDDHEFEPEGRSA